MRDYYSLFILWFLIEILLLIFVHLATNTESTDEKDQQKNHKEIGEPHARRMIDIRVIIEVIVVIHIVVVNENNRCVEMVVVPVKPTI